MGSPPHTRGTLTILQRSIRMIRITPAYAGNTVTSGKLNHPIRDHPRIRGEHNKVDDYLESTLGSPPHTRGTLLTARLLRHLLRITPAYAGNTQNIYKNAYIDGDHPRIRGEHLRGYQAVRKKLGSPPHTRGTRPANTSPPPEFRDHPRIRGEHK